MLKAGLTRPMLTSSWILIAGSLGTTEGLGSGGEGRAPRLAETTLEADSKTVTIGQEWNSHGHQD